jgi:hypothetical protein
MRTPLLSSRRMWLVNRCLEQDLGLLWLTDGEDAAAYNNDYLENVYRVQIMGGGEIRVLKLGVSVDEEVEGVYSAIDALPDWVKERLAVLMVVDARHKPAQEIEGIGRRISEKVFWVYAPKTNTDATVSL